MILPRLYAIVDPLNTGHDPIALADAFLAGGARLLQVRLPAATARHLLEITRAIVARAHPLGARVLVNDRPDVAVAAGADGVHVGQHDLPVTAVRALVGPQAIVGISTHDAAEARAAAALPVDYLGVGPIYTTESKADALAPRGLALVHAVRAVTSLPLVAIGGITTATAADVVAAGADAVAMIGALVRSTAPAETVAALVTALGD